MNKRNGTMKERVSRKPIGEVAYSIGKEGLYVRVNGFKEFIIKPESIKMMYEALYPVPEMPEPVNNVELKMEATISSIPRSDKK